MRRRSPIAVPLGLLALLAGTPALTPLEAQSVPTTLNYQGRLLQNSAEQDAVTGAVDISFSLWSGPASDGSAFQLWSEGWTGVVLSNGIFSVLLGSNGSPLDPAVFQAGPSLFLQLEIDGEVLLPRQQLGSAPFAMMDEPGNELQDLELAGDILGLTGSAATVDLSPYRDTTDPQTLALSGTTLSISESGSSVSLAAFLDNTDAQTLALSGTTLSISGSDSSVDLAALLDDTEAQTLALSGTTLSISGSGSSVSLAAFLDNTDSQNLANVLAQGNSAGNRNITNVATISATGLNCPNCITSSDIAQDTILGNDITDNIYIVHIDCNGSCNDISMPQACRVIEHQRNLATRVELIGVSCVHGVPSTTGNGFVPCNDGTGDIGDNECRAFNLRTLGDIPCVDGSGTDAIVTCLATNIPR